MLKELWAVRVLVVRVICFRRACRAMIIKTDLLKECTKKSFERKRKVKEND